MSGSSSWSVSLDLGWRSRSSGTPSRRSSGVSRGSPSSVRCASSRSGRSRERLASGSSCGTSPDRPVWCLHLGVAAIVRCRYIPSGAVTVAVRVFERERLGAVEGSDSLRDRTRTARGRCGRGGGVAGRVRGAGRKPPLIAVVALVLVLVVARSGATGREVVGALAGGRSVASEWCCFEPASFSRRHCCARARGWSLGLRPGSSSVGHGGPPPGFSYCSALTRSPGSSASSSPLRRAGSVSARPRDRTGRPVVGVAPRLPSPWGCASKRGGRLPRHRRGRSRLACP